MNLLNLRSLPSDEIRALLNAAVEYRMRPARPELEGKAVALLFYEPSTRTRISFERAARLLGATVMQVSASTSSVTKGESLKDTVLTLAAEGVDAIVLRHPSSGAPEMAAKRFDGAVVNAGDGWHEHPTQALLDMLTILDHRDRIEGVEVALVGDILHSRVARSNIWGLSKLGAHVRLIGPPTLMPPDVEQLPAEIYTDLRRGITDADVVMTLRLQRERMSEGLLPSLDEYARLFQVNSDTLRAAPGALVMHPGPMNRGVEISDDAADGARSVILEQVRNGVPVRMAALAFALKEARFAAASS